MRLLFAGLVATVALAAAGASSPAATIGGQPAAMPALAVGGQSGLGSRSIEVDTRPDRTPLPRRIEIHVPAGYRLDLSEPPGTAVASIELLLDDPGNPAAGGAFGSLVASDATKPVGGGCAPGLHAAVWTFEQQTLPPTLDLTFYVDPASGGYVLVSCPSGLPAAKDGVSASLVLYDMGVLTPPATASTYVWRANVTPVGGAPYELRALVPLPESVVVDARYDPARKAAVVSGRVVEAGKPSAGTSVTVTASPGKPVRVRTGHDGRFAFTRHIARSTIFDASAPSTRRSCTCLHAAVMPPDDGFAMAWIAVRTGARRAVRAADQRLADTQVISASDLDRDYRIFGPGIEACANETHESGLTITGESVSADYEGSLGGPSTGAVGGIARVYATAGEARAALTREATGATARCEALPPHREAVHELKIPGAVGFRTSVRLGIGTDTIFILRNRSLQRLVFGYPAGQPPADESAVIGRVAARMR